MANISTGIPGLDDVLAGGLTPGRLYLLEGTPGTGKTTLALQFLLDGARLGESVLYVTLSETVEELHGVADSHGWDISKLHVRELLPSPESLQPEEQYTVFHPSEVELGETTRRVLADVEELKPTRVVFDSLSELRLLAGTSLRYRRQILALKQFFGGRRCTVMMLDDMTSADHDLQVQSISHAVLRLEQVHSDYGSLRRRLLVLKYRGHDFRSGFHDYKITKGSLIVFPRLIANEHAGTFDQSLLPSGVTTLDELLGGGISRGTSTLLVGAPGTGKSSVAVQFAYAAALRKECAALFIFDENTANLITRAAGLGIDLRPHIQSNHIRIRQVDPAELSPGELIHAIREAVETHRAKVIVIDSLNGYLNAMPDEKFLVVQLHELLTYLAQAGVATILVGAQQGLVGPHMQSPVDASYLADSVILLRYYEIAGEVRQAISVMKKRTGRHERTIRSFKMSALGLELGPPLREFHGVLTGLPMPTKPGNPESGE